MPDISVLTQSNEMLFFKSNLFYYIFRHIYYEKIQRLYSQKLIVFHTIYVKIVFKFRNNYIAILGVRRVNRVVINCFSTFNRLNSNHETYENGFSASNLRQFNYILLFCSICDKELNNLIIC